LDLLVEELGTLGTVCEFKQDKRLTKAIQVSTGGTKTQEKAAQQVRKALVLVALLLRR
jgi:hypothetical protein